MTDELGNVAADDQWEAAWRDRLACDIGQRCSPTEARASAARIMRAVLSGDVAEPEKRG